MGSPYSFIHMAGDPMGSPYRFTHTASDQMGSPYSGRENRTTLL